MAAGRTRKAAPAWSRIALDTVYSLSESMPPQDAAGAESHGELQAGSLIVGSIRELCLVRKIAAGGAILHTQMPLNLDERIELDLATGEQIAGTVAWRRGPEVGLRFEKPIDILPILARNLAGQPGERRRMPRVELSCRGRIKAGSRDTLVRLRDLSQGGARIESHVPFAAGEEIELQVEGLPLIAGSVRWAEGGVAGLAFDPELEWQALMPWLRARLAARPSRPDVPPAVAPSQEEKAEESGPGSVQLNLAARVREGTRRWGIEVTGLTVRHVQFNCYSPLPLGTLLWVVLPGLEGWPARIVTIEGYGFTAEFTQALHPAVLERILAVAAIPPGRT